MNRNIIAAIVVGVLVLGIGIVTLAQNKPAALDDNAPTADSTPAASTNASAESEQAVTIEGYAYKPAAINVKVGTKVTWTNQDIARHNVRSENDSPNKGLDGPLIGKGESWSYTFTQAGTYTYYCSPHPYMKATVTVTP